MTRTIKPQFADMKTCGFCGAPAEIIGQPWMRDGVLTWYSKPVSYKGRVFTHCCTRNAFEDHTGKPSTQDCHRYECGAIQSKDTIRVMPQQMFGRCFDSAAEVALPDVTECVSTPDRQTVAAGGAQ